VLLNAQPTSAASQSPIISSAWVLERDGQQGSATQTRAQALADADHLAIRHAIWAADPRQRAPYILHGQVTQQDPPDDREHRTSASR
jgi:hypothetical protein